MSIAKTKLLLRDNDHGYESEHEPVAHRDDGAHAEFTRNLPGLPHICFVAPEAWPVFAGKRDIPVVGGAEVQQSILIRALSKAGYPVSMICLDFGQPDGVRVDGIPVYKTYSPGAGMPVVRFVHPRLTSLWGAMRRVNADIYYQRSACMLTGVVAAFCAWHNKKSIYAGASDMDFIPGRQSIHYGRDRWMFERGLRSSSAIVTQNAFQQAKCREHYGRESTIVPSCYALPPGAQAAPAGYVLWAGTMRACKQPEALLEIARRLPQYRFVMIGGADSHAAGKRYFSLIQEEAAQVRNIDFKGFVPFSDIETYFNGARLVINTSHYEGLPNTFLQAWSRGIPTVAFVDTGSRHHGSPAYYIAADVADATQEIGRLMRDDAHWEYASKRCNQHFRERHSVQSVSALYAQVFSQLGVRS